MLLVAPLLLWEDKRRGEHYSRLQCMLQSLGVVMHSELWRRCNSEGASLHRRTHNMTNFVHTPRCRVAVHLRKRPHICGLYYSLCIYSCTGTTKPCSGHTTQTLRIRHCVEHRFRVFNYLHVQHALLAPGVLFYSMHCDQHITLLLLAFAEVHLLVLVCK